MAAPVLAPPHELPMPSFARVFTRGVPLGFVLLFAVAGAAFAITSPTYVWPILLATALPALFAGWYFGGIIMLTRIELAEERTLAAQHAEEAHQP
jgi:hypothetical protein